MGKSLRCKLGLHKNTLVRLILYCNSGDMWDVGYSLYYKVFLCDLCEKETKKEVSQEEYWKYSDSYPVEVEQ